MNKKVLVSKTTTCRKEYKIATNYNFQDPYWDEGFNYVRTYAFKWSKKDFKALQDKRNGL
jgi:hypothetical protein